MRVGAVVVAVGAVAALALGGRVRALASEPETDDSFAELGAATA
jgi:hypothetical protein